MKDNTRKLYINNEMRKAVFWNSYTINKKTNCWEWNLSKNKDGYGLFRLLGKIELAHRVSYIFCYNEELTKEDVVMHHCDNPCCINPLHLQLTDIQGNLSDKHQKYRGRMMNKKSKFVGVYWRNDINKWRSCVNKGGKSKHLGNFELEKDAAIAYDNYMIYTYGYEKVYKNLNIPRKR